MSIPEEFANFRLVKPGVNEGLSLVERARRYTRKVICGLAATACLAVGVGVVPEIADGPRHSSVVELDDKEVCRESVFVAVYFSGTGLQTAEYAARNDHDIARENDACVLHVDYGTHYDPEEIGQKLVEWTDETYGKNNGAYFLFIGDSFGGIAAQAVANSQAFRGAEQMHVAGLLLQSTPGGAECVEGGARRMFVDTVSPGFTFGKTPILISNVLGSIDRGMNPSSNPELSYILDNTKKTSSALTSDEAAAIRNNGSGFPVPLEPVNGDRSPDYFYMVSKNDKVQDPECSKQIIQSKIGSVVLEAVMVSLPPGRGELNHGSGWQVERHEFYVDGTLYVFGIIRGRVAALQR